MTDISTRTGWERLSNGFDVEFRHGIPIRVSDNGKRSTLPEPALTDEIAALGGLRIRMGEWRTGTDANEHEAPLLVSGEQLDEVLDRLARASATLFFDRYGKSIDKDDVDWDTLEFVSDFSSALEYCGLDRADVDQDSYSQGYLDSMHRETRRLAASQETPSVEPEE